MPYIRQIYRDKIDAALQQFCDSFPHGIHTLEEGEMNYVITKFLLMSIPDSAKYRDYERIIGRIEMVKQEMYRRMIAPYEDKKKEENGDVFPQSV